MDQDKEKYTVCDRCGSHLLEKCAYEEDDSTLCGGCVAIDAEKSATVAHQKAQEIRHQINEEEKEEIVKKQRKGALLVLVIAVGVLMCAQLFIRSNRPEPVESVSFDPQQNVQVTKSLILMAVNEYYETHSKAPKQLRDLVPEYLPDSFSPVFVHYHYSIDASGAIVLEELKSHGK